MSDLLRHLRLVVALAVSLSIAAAAAAQEDTRCAIAGRVASGNTPLPGVSVTVRSDQGSTATSSSVSGEWTLRLRPGTYRLDAELMGFNAVEQELIVTAESCSGAPASPPLAGDAGAMRRQTVDLTMTLLTRTAVPSALPSTGFHPLVVQRAASAGFAADAGAEPPAAQVASLALPAGFSVEPGGDAVAINGAATDVDRGALEERAGNGRGGGAFAAGRRGGRLYSATTSYTMAGSALDSAPFQLRPGSPTTKPDYLRQSMDFTVGAPLKIPGVYDGTRRTNLTLSYSMIRGDNLFDQYATVPSAAMRAGDFSALTVSLVDPATGQPFPGNQMPSSRHNPGSLALLALVPLPNVDGTSRNFHYTTTTGATQDNLQLRVTHNFTPAPTSPRRATGSAGSGGAAERTTASLSSNIQYRSSDNQRINLFPSLGGMTTGSTLTIPLNLNLTHRRVQHTINVSYARTRSETRNHYAFVQNVAAAAGIAGAASDPFDWGVPALAFSSLSNVTDLTPGIRLDTRLSAGYSWGHWVGKQHFRFGGDIRREVTTSRSDANARGAFVFTGLYSGSDFADFLLGQAQQASVQYGPGTVRLHSRSLSVYAQHEWWYGYFTVNSGVRYELTGPYVDAGDRLANLDVAPDFSAAVPVRPGDSGPFSGAFPDALFRTDVNNVLPRLGLAWQPSQGTIVRLGYGISINSGSYGNIARQLATQPPFAVTSTTIGTESRALAIANALTSAAPATANTFGVAHDYELGRVQTWNVDVSREIAYVWTVSGAYTGARGSGLDVIRAPNRGPNGLRISGVQPFLWQTADGSSRLHSANLRLRRRPVKGIGGNLSYTVARAMDDASTIGGGQTVVAQDDQNLAAEWGRSSFDRRHQLAAGVSIELPFGPNRRWANGDGAWSRLLEAWSVSISASLQSGTPLTVRALSTASDVARGTNGTLRADYNHEPIALDEPGIDRFFNTSAFSLPVAGAFGTAGRNIVTGPGSKDLTAQFTRDLRLGGSRSVSVQLRAANLLNLVNYAAVDTIVNSPTFGQVTSVRPMRSLQLNVRFRY